MKNLENQVRLLATLLFKRSQGCLPSNTEKNPKEEVKAMTLWNGRELEEVENKEVEKVNRKT